MTILGDKTTATARKQYQCWWCGCGIQIGDKYVRWIWKDGSRVPMRINVHDDCHEAWQDLQPDDVMEGEFARGCTCANGDCRCA